MRVESSNHFMSNKYIAKNYRNKCLYLYKLPILITNAMNNVTNYYNYGLISMAIIT